MTTFRVLLATALMTGTALAQLPDGPTWGRGRFQPEGHNVLFATADGCALCHTASEDSVALRDRMGHDVSPHQMWQGTMMAQALRDPYYRAQVESEVLANPEGKAEIENLCLTCHSPMAHHTARIAKSGPLGMAEAEVDPLARDGVSCTVCHQVRPEGLGHEVTFNGKLDIQPGRRIFGPYPRPLPGPMRMHSGFTPEQGTHVTRSGLCASCHTLSTPTADETRPFIEQAPYLEWQNSIFGGLDDDPAQTRSCQECHMPELDAMRLAHNPRGLDFNISPRPSPRAHSFVGANAFMLELLRDNADELDVIAPAEALTHGAMAARQQLKDRTAQLKISKIRVENAHATFSIEVVNLAGHKFPTSYPSRRAVLQVEVRQGGTMVFLSGGFDANGGLADVADERSIPHRQFINSPEQVQVWEAVPVDAEGQPTTLLTRMDRFGKDNRILPRGWAKDGPHASKTAPVGVMGDVDFEDGHDSVHYDCALPDADSGAVTVIARLVYQSIPPSWVEPLRSVEGPASKRFVRMYDAANRMPEPVAIAIRRADE